MNYRAAITLSPFILFTLACFSEVPGDRAQAGCPAEEVCSPETPSGLFFSGEAFYDEVGLIRLGPVLAGGSFDLGYRPMEGWMGDADVVSSDGAVMTAEGLRDRPDLLSVGGVRVRGVSEGEAMVRVVDAKGRLYDRLPMSIYAMDHVDVHNLLEPDVDVLITGCEAMMGIHLMVKDGALDIRAFDKGMWVTANGEAVASEGGTWDCFRFVPGEDAVELEVNAGGESFSFGYKVRPLGEYETCPERTD